MEHYDDPLFERLKKISDLKAKERNRSSLLRSDYPSKYFKDLNDCISKRVEKYNQLNFDFNLEYIDGKDILTLKQKVEKKIAKDKKLLEELKTGDRYMKLWSSIRDREIELMLLYKDDLYKVGFIDLSCRNSIIRLGMSFNDYLIEISIYEKSEEINDGEDEYIPSDLYENSYLQHEYFLKVVYCKYQFDPFGERILDENDRYKVIELGNKKYEININSDLTVLWDTKSNNELTNELFTWLVEKSEK